MPGQYLNGIVYIQVPLPNTKVMLISLPTKNKARIGTCTVYAEATTDSQGHFKMVVPVGTLPPGATLGLSVSGCVVIYTVTVDAGGSLIETQANVPTSSSSIPSATSAPAVTTQPGAPTTLPGAAQTTTQQAAATTQQAAVTTTVVPVPTTTIAAGITTVLTAGTTTAETTNAETTTAAETTTEVTSSATDTETVTMSSTTESSTTPTMTTSATTTYVPPPIITIDPPVPKINAPRLKPRDINVLFSETNAKADDATRSVVNCILHPQDPTDVVCRVKNLYYHYTRGFFLVGDTTSNPQLVDLVDMCNYGTIKGVDRGFVVVVSTSLFKTNKVKEHKARTHVFGRLVPENVFHELHDALLPLALTVQEFGNNKLEEVELLAADAHPFPKGSTVEPFWYSLLLPPGSSMNATIQETLFQSKTRNILAESTLHDVLHVWKDAVIGLRKNTIWYDYGFKEHQHPVDVKPSDIVARKESVGKAVNWLSNRALQEPGPAPPTKRQILVFDRQFNRKILNVDELIKKLSSEYEPRGLEVQKVMMETHSQRQLVALVKSADLIIGMHGSMLGLGMMSQKVNMIEMFPYGVPSDNYQVYRRMCELLESCRYAAWENHDIGKNKVPALDANKHHGGLAHLAKDEQQKIINQRWVDPHRCCEDPAWLYRIYSDTIVDVTKIVELARSMV